MTHVTSYYFISKFGNTDWFLPSLFNLTLWLFCCFSGGTSFSPFECTLYSTEMPFLCWHMYYLCLVSKNQWSSYEDFVSKTYVVFSSVASWEEKDCLPKSNSICSMSIQISKKKLFKGQNFSNLMKIISPHIQ